MVNYNPKSWWGLIFRFHKSDTFRILLPALVSIALFTAAIAYVHVVWLPGWLAGTPVVHSLLGLVISLLLVFRTNTAYERWWEGRRQWGALVNASRNLALKLDAFLPKGHDSRAVLAGLMGDYAQTLAHHLRGRLPPGVSMPAGHGPNQLAARLLGELNRLYRQGDISGEQLLCLNGDITAFTDVCGACERIQKTPIPYSYSLFLKKFIFAYIVSMPFCFVPQFHYWSVLLATFMFYVLASLELIAEEVENPFGDDANDLPTEQIAETIRRNVHEALTVECRS
ncbi:bestrophin family protein [Methylogaea oryzae]|uniref:Membrane protein n=1 Tax=Methylogaea oryzae TaxID=1295382 RepID=A0A8D4VLB6_9GAMM|nr:bestrophin family ion channel [Methylogaea oryzae]BBL69681.1 membrane protein [Methylogaea oryzae]